MPVKYNVSKFAKNQLHKSGWVEGKGLGRKEDGMSEALKVKIKADTAGVGHDPGEQFTFHWWDHAFQKSAQNINVTEKENGVTVETLGETEEASVTKKNKKLLKEKLLYGSFVKSGTLENGKMHKDNGDDSDDESSGSDCSTLKKSRILTDEELYAACGGRTAHKGARHGLRLSAKLARLQEQEGTVSKNDSNVKRVKKKRKDKTDGVKVIENSNSPLKVKKKRKRSRNKMDVPSSTDEQSLEKTAIDSAYQATKKAKSGKSKKKRRTTDEIAA